MQPCASLLPSTRCAVDAAWAQISKLNGLSACDAQAELGVSILTLTGRPPVGRIGTSLMTNLGPPEWAALRAGLRQEMQSSPLMDEVGFVRKVETAYREMFGKWARG